jgi:ketosteroid isomerase-like protein
LRDYERAWAAGDGDALAALFTPDGFVRAEAGWIRGTAAITARYANAGGDLRLRALAYADGETVGYIVGAYGYGESAAVSDRGSFVLALRRGPDGRWRIAADLDHSI